MSSIDSSHGPRRDPLNLERRLNPDLFGSLTDDPILETGTSALFPGEERFLSKSATRKRRQLLQWIEPTLGRVLEEDESLLYVLPAHQVPTLADWFGLGLFFMHLHKVALVLTDRRLIEILMDLRGTAPSTRIRSYPWAGEPLLKSGIGKLSITPSIGRKVTWRIAARGDRRLLKALVPRIAEQITRTAVPSSVGEPVYWSCPECGGTVAPNPASCSRCATRFRKPRVAAWLSLAFPGAGLFYAKRRVLGTFDLLGELFLFAWFAMLLMISSAFEEMIGFLVFGFFVLALTKLESIHLSNILVRRAIPITESGEGRWRRFAYSGTALSVVALGLMFAATGMLYTSLNRDLDVARGAEGWEGTRTVAEFSYEDDWTQRSEWVNETGLYVSVFAYPGVEGETLVDYRAEYEASLLDQENVGEAKWFELPSSFEGFGVIVQYLAPGEPSWFEIDYFLWDSDGPAVHQIVTGAYEEELQAATESVQDFLDSAGWIAAVEPRR